MAFLTEFLVDGDMSLQLPFLLKGMTVRFFPTNHLSSVYAGVFIRKAKVSSIFPVYAGFFTHIVQKVKVKKVYRGGKEQNMELSLRL